MLKHLPAILLLTTAHAALAETPQITNYLGTIDGNLPISMALDTNRQAHVSGTYVYCRYGKPISLAGRRTYDPAPRPDFIFKESDSGGGSFELNPAKDGSLSGTWKSSDGKRSLPVALSPAAKTITLLSAKSNRYEVSTAYLEFTANTPLAKALNTRLAKAALDSHNKTVRSLSADTEKEADIAAGLFPYVNQSTPFLLYASDSLISFRSLNYSYTGGAHGNWGYSPANYAFLRGSLVELTPDMIVPQANWPALRDLCVQDLTTRGTSSPKDITFDHTSPPAITFTSYGLLISFDPYQAGSYAEGAYIVSLPYSKAKALFSPNTPLAPLLPK